MARDGVYIAKVEALTLTCGILVDGGLVEEQHAEVHVRVEVDVHG